MKDVKKNKKTKIGILDIQGSVEEHYSALQKIKNIQIILVKNADDFKDLAGLIIPGGESTVIGKLLKKFGLDKIIILSANNGMAVWGTCAGAILLAKKVVGKEKADGLGLIDITIERNSYGRQLDSFESKLKFAGKNIQAIFIRAPRILAVGHGVNVLAKLGKEAVAVKQNNIFVTTFHPELTDDLLVHKYFVDMCSSANY